MFFSAISMFLTIALLATWVPHTIKLRVVGYAYVVDIIVLGSCLFLFGGTGTERMGALAAGIGITCLLHTYRWWAGYEVYESYQGRYQWMRYPSFIERMKRRALAAVRIKT